MSDFGYVFPTTQQARNDSMDRVTAFSNRCRELAELEMLADDECKPITGTGITV